MKRHANIPIFVPHVGCPNDCVFCNQRTISGKEEFRIENVEKEIEEALTTLSSRVPQIAFFGGSFTGIERGLMIRLLETANKYITAGKASSVRLSTRPDYISDEILDILEKYNVKNIELGIQSMNDRVLSLNRRGHNAETSRLAMKKIVEKGFELTGQMMTGMYGANAEDEVNTAHEISKYASSARIYPTVTFKKTALANLWESGEYVPPSLEETVERGAAVYKVFEGNGVDVIRIGLQSTEGLHSSEVLAGEYHDAIGEMILSRVRLDELRERAKNLEIKDGCAIFHVPSRIISQYIGQKRENVLTLERELGVKVKICGI
ncbi:MAG: radical SAM protein [Ruminococcaceae bacterium]|nr:radical SAM protein [Oscillospiraceae bacterium]